MPVETRSTVRRVGSGVADVGEAREHDQSAGGDAIHVVPGQEVAAAQLADAEVATRSLSRSSRLETDDGVGDGELGRVGRLVRLVLADPQRRNGQDGESAGEVMEEPTELGIARGERSQRLEAVDHDDARLMLP